MANLTKRNIDILKIIVEEFLNTWDVLWSKALLKKYDLWVSSATVRNDMAMLEELELIYQPYASAGRLPTTKGIRAFITYLMDQTPDYFLESWTLNIKNNNIKTFEDFIHNITYELSKKTKEISFFISKEDNILKYSWVSYCLTENKKILWEESICNLIKILEDKNSFVKFITSLQIHTWVNVFVGEENIIPFLKDYTIILKQTIVNWDICYVGLIWSLKMNYSFNISAIKGII